MIGTITKWRSLTETTGGTEYSQPWDDHLCLLADDPGPYLDDRHPGWSPGSFKGQRRHGSCVKALYALVLDCDETMALQDAEEHFGGWYGLIHTTKRHTDKAHRYRVILPLARAVSAFEYRELWRRFDARWPDTFDGQAKDPSRFWYLPSKPDSGRYYTHELGGDPLDPDEVLTWCADKPRAPTERGWEAPTGTGYAATALVNEVDYVATRPIGERNAALNTAAFNLAQLVAGGALQESIVRAELTRAAMRCGLEEREIRATLDSGIRAGLKHPRTVSEPHREFAHRAESATRHRDPPKAEPQSPPERPVTAVERYGVVTVRDLLRDAYEHAKRREPEQNVPTCHRDLDQLMRGFRRGRVAILGALTSWGKSSWAVMVADEAVRAGLQPLIVTTEDAREVYQARFSARRANVNAIRLLSGQCTDEDLAKLAAAADRAEKTPAVLPALGWPIERITTALAALCNELDPDLVVLDYLQSTGTSGRTQDRRNEITHIARMFCDTVKQAGTSGLLISQFRRLVGGTRPGLHDLKESGDLENMAEHVLLGWREVDTDQLGAPGAERRYLKLAKNKDGPVSADRLLLPWDETTASFRRFD